MIYLKKHRLENGLTQKDVAVRLGVTQSTYQRWETGSLQIPDEKLETLAALFDTTTAALRGRHPPRDITVYSKNGDQEFEYFGEATFHFNGPGASLLLHISTHEMELLRVALETDDEFIVVRSLSNQIVAVRRSALADVYISSEACDEYGPEQGSYEVPPLMMPDPRDWYVLEAMLTGGVAEEDQLTAQRIKAKLENPWGDPVNAFLGLREQRDFTPEQLSLAWRMAERLVFSGTYQLSKGSLRTFPFEATANAFRSFTDIFDVGGMFEDETDIVYSNEMDGQIIFIKGSVVDYISLPAHRWDDAQAEALSESEADL